MPLAKSYATLAMDAVAAFITARSQAGDFGQTVEAVRDFVPVNQVKELPTARATVAVGEYSAAKKTRGHSEHKPVIRVLLQKFIPESNKLSATQAMEDILCRIADLLLWNPLGENGEIIPESVELDPVFSPQDMREFSVFSGVVAVTYTIIAAKP